MAGYTQGQGMDRGRGEKAKLSRELKNLKWGLSVLLKERGLGGGPRSVAR